MNSASPVSTLSARAVPLCTSPMLYVCAGLLSIGLFLVGATLAAVAVVAAALGWAVVAHRNLAIYLFAFLLFTNAAVVASQFHGVPKAAAAAVAGLLLIPLARSVLIDRQPLIVSPAAPLFVVFVGLQLVGILWADDKSAAISATVSTLTEGLILYVLVTNAIRSGEVLRRVVWVLLLAASLLSALSAYQQLRGDFRNTLGGFAQSSVDDPVDPTAPAPKEGRSAGSIGEKNYYAQFLLMLLPLALVRISGEKRPIMRLAAAGAAGMICLGIVCTASRGAAVGFAVLLLVMVWIGEVKIRHLLLMVGILAPLVLLVPAYQARVVDSIDSVRALWTGGKVNTLDKSSQGRLSEMLAAVLIFSEHPLLGVGPGNFPLHFVEKAGTLGFQVHTEQRLAHCSYLEFAAEMGIAGLVVYLAILGVTLRGLLRARRSTTEPGAANMATAFLLVVIVMMATSVFLSFAYERYYWFTLALAAVAARTKPVGVRSRKTCEDPVVVT